LPITNLLVTNLLITNLLITYLLITYLLITYLLITYLPITYLPITYLLITYLLITYLPITYLLITYLLITCTCPSPKTRTTKNTHLTRHSLSLAWSTRLLPAPSAPAPLLATSFCKHYNCWHAPPPPHYCDYCHQYQC
jgi:hypothetical protein